MYVVKTKTLTGVNGTIGIDFLKGNRITISYASQDVIVDGEPWKALGKDREVIIPAPTQKSLMIRTDSKREGIIKKIGN